MTSNAEQPLVSVGLPVYDRPRLLYRALECLTKQTYLNLEIIISDDCSPGEETRKVVQEFIEKNARIQYYCQQNNLGPVLNHKFVFEKATGEYFFWASEDDEWHEEFVEIGVQTLLANSQYDAWCCTMNNIDGFGRVSREYPGFSRFTSTRNKALDIVKYLFEPEVMGKANIFHSIFRRGALEKTIQEYFFGEVWGSDYCFNLAFLARFNLIGTDQVLHYKRVESSSDNEVQVHPVLVENSSRHIFPLNESLRYLCENYRAARTTPYRGLVVFVMLLRLPIAIRNEYVSIQALKGFFRRIVCNRITRKVRRTALLIVGFSLHDLSWRRQFGYKRDPKIIDVRWGMVDTYGVIQVPLNIIRASIVTPTGNRLFTIEETPHYPWIKALIEGHDDRYARAKYREYTETYWPEEIAEDVLATVVNLVESFRAHHDTPITIVTLPPALIGDSDIYVQIYDGVHRTAIAKALGHEFVRCRLVSSRINSHDIGCRIIDSPITRLS